MNHATYILTVHNAAVRGPGNEKSATWTAV